jgi:hypothetical protein
MRQLEKVARRMKRSIVGLAIGGLAVVGCGGGSSSQAKPAPTVTVQAPAPTVTTQAPAQPAPSQSTSDQSTQVNFNMPNMVSKDLQSAQDEVQTHGVNYSISHDLLGTRMQVLDSNWQVCTQTPAAGSAVKGGGWEGKIDFGVVKLTETCP